MNAIFWNDLETTGTDKVRCSIIQIAAAIEKDGEIVETFESKMRPMEGKIVDPGALEVTGYTEEEIKTFPHPTEVYARFRMFCDRHGVKGVKHKRFIPGGYNNKFDLDFLQVWHSEMSGGPFAFWDYLQFNPIDPLPQIVNMWRAGVLPLKNCQLSTVCEYFGVEIKAHDALSDVLASREISRLVLGKINSQWTGEKYGAVGPEKESECITQ